MYPVTTDYLNAIGSYSRRFRCAVTIRDMTFTDENIAEIILDETVNPDESFMLGCATSAKLTLTMLDLPSTLILENAPVTIQLGLLVNDAYVDIPFGSYIVETVEKDKRSVKLTCYDNMIKFEQPYFSNLDYPAALSTVVNEICTKAGVTLATSVPSDTIEEISGYTLREAIGFIASYLGGFARINRAGELEITSYYQTGVTVGQANYATLKIAEAPFTIGRLTCITGVDADGNNIVLTSGTSGNEVVFENPIMTQDRLDTLLYTLSSIEYLPYDMSWQGNPALMAGDRILLVDKNGIAHDTLIMEQQLKYTGGLSGTAKAKGATQTAQDYQSTGSITSRVNRYVAEQAQIKTLLAEKASITDLEAVEARIDNLVVDTAQIADASITTAKIADAQITNAKIADASIDAAKIIDGTITNAEIANATITGAKIALATIDTANIVDGAITNAKIASAAIGSANIQDAAVGTAKIQAGAITTALIETGAVGTAQIADGSITDAKIVSLTANKVTAGTIDTGQVTVQGTNGKLKVADNRLQVFDNQAIPVERVSIGDINNDGTIYGLRVRGADGVTVLYDQNGVYTEGITDGAITNPKIGTDAVDNRVIAANAVTADNIVAGAITTDKLAAQAVTADKIATGAITAGSAIIADGAITTAKIGDAQITSAKIANASIDAAKIIDGSITNAEIANATITGAKIALATIDTANIKDAAITNAKISSLDASKITTGTLSADRIAANSITGDKIAAHAITVDELSVLIPDRNLIPDSQGSFNTWTKYDGYGYVNCGNMFGHEYLPDTTYGNYYIHVEFGSINSCYCILKNQEYTWERQIEVEPNTEYYFSAMVAMVSYQNDYDGLYVYKNYNAIIVYDFDNIAIQSIALPNTGISQYTNTAVDEVIFHTIEQVFTTPANAHHIRIRVGGVLTGGSGQTKNVVFDISRINLVKGGLMHAYKPAPNELTFGQAAYHMKPALNLDNVLNALDANITYTLTSHDINNSNNITNTNNIKTNSLTSVNITNSGTVDTYKLTSTTITNSGSLTTDTLTANTVNTNRLQGKSSINALYIGSGTCRFDVNGGTFRIQQSPKNYMLISPTGRVAIYVAGVAKHIFMEDGTKRGGTIVIDGINYGMSPIDSPEILISDLVQNVKLVKGINTIELDERTAKAIDGYSVFFESPNVIVQRKHKNNFTVYADSDIITDVIIIGHRQDYKGHKWKEVEAWT